MMLGNNKKKRKENPPKASEGKGKQKKKKREIRSPDFTRKAQKCNGRLMYETKGVEPSLKGTRKHS